MEFVIKDLVKKAGLEEQFKLISAVTSAEEQGNPVHPPARRELARHRISCQGHNTLLEMLTEGRL